MQHVESNVLERCIISDNDIIINLNEGETLYVKKFVKFKVLRGTCTLLGYIFRKSDNIYTVQIPKWHPPEPLTAIIDSLGSDSLSLSFINHTSAFNTYSFIDCVDNIIHNGDSTYHHMTYTKIIPDQWHKCADLIPKNGSIAFHGEKGAGKSTAVIYFTNYLLNKCHCIIIIDVDVGQPLFTVPGVISLHILNKPILRPGYSMNSEDFIYSKEILIGDVSLSDPKKVLERAITLEKHLKTSITNLNIIDYKVLINTGGWISDTGGQFFDCLIRIFSVNIVLSIISKPDVIGYKHQEINFLTDILPENIKDINPEIVNVNSYKIGNITSTSPRPSDLRWLRIAAYLNPSLGDLLEIHSFTHYEFFSGIDENIINPFIKNPTLLTPPIPIELKMSKLTFYLLNGSKMMDFQLKNHFLAGCIAALFTHKNNDFEDLITNDFIFIFIHSINEDKLLILYPKQKTIEEDKEYDVVLCPLLGFDPHFPILGRCNSTFIPYERNNQLHLTKHLGTSNCSRRGVKKRSHEEDKI